MQHQRAGYQLPEEGVRPGLLVQPAHIPGPGPHAEGPLQEAEGEEREGGGRQERSRGGEAVVEAGEQGASGGEEVKVGRQAEGHDKAGANEQPGEVSVHSGVISIDEFNYKVHSRQRELVQQGQVKKFEFCCLLFVI